MKQLKIVNIKKLVNKQFELPDSGAVAILGGNDTGKSTVIQCIQDILLAKNFINNPVTKGEQIGEIEYTGKDINGNVIVVRMEVLPDGSSNISAVYQDPDGGKNRKVSNVTTIRDLLGNYFPLTVHQVFSQLKYAEGRKDFFDKYISRLLNTSQMERIAFIDREISIKENKQTQGNLFFTRRDKMRELSEKEAILNSMNAQETPKFTVDQLIKAEEQGKKELASIKERQQERLNKLKITERISEIARDISNGIARLTELGYDAVWLGETHDRLMDEINKVWNKEEKDKEIQQDSVLENTIREKLDRIIKMKVDWEHIEIASQTIVNLTQTVDNLKKDIQVLSDKIEALRKERSTIIQASSFPEGMSIDDEYNVFINDILMNESSISETMARVYIIKMLLIIAGGGFIDIGDWSLYDKDNRKLIIELAAKHKCLLMGQYVTDEDEVTVKTIG